MPGSEPDILMRFHKTSYRLPRLSGGTGAVNLQPMTIHGV